MSFDHLLMLFRPLLTVPEAMWLLGYRAPQSIVRWVECGGLRAVDISGEKEADRRELRIYRYSIEHLFLAPERPLDRPPVEMILPHRRATFRADEVAQVLNCTPRHVSKLALSRGEITRKKLIAFLGAREVRK
jgi:hypothetical protein